MKKTVKIAIAVALACVAALCLFSCNMGSEKTSCDTSATGKGTKINMKEVEALIDSMSVEDFEAHNGESDFVLIKVKDYGDIVLVLRSDVAPGTVKNFKKLVSEGFYDGTVFHRVMEDFMIQGGGFISKDGSLIQKSADTIKGEFTFNGHVNNLRHFRGVVSMARVGGMNNSASSQFFIVHQTNIRTLKLDGDYATFGYVLAGMDVVDAIATCKVSGVADAPRPVVDIVVESVSFVKLK